MVSEAKEGNLPYPNILITNFHSSWNAGDDVLLQEALHQLRDQFPSASFTLAMNDPMGYRGSEITVGAFTSWVKRGGHGSADHWYWPGFVQLLVESGLTLARPPIGSHPMLRLVSLDHRPLLQAYLDADLVVSCAGNFLYSSGRIGLPFFLALFSIAFASWVGKPVYGLPQTLGPFQRKREARLVRAVLRRMRLVLVRDSISIAVCDSWHDPKINWRYCPDIAFSFTHDDVKEAHQLLASYGVDPDLDSPLLGVTLIDWGGQYLRFRQQAAYERAVALALRRFLDTYGGKVIVFAQVQGPSSSEDDRLPARRVCAQLNDLGQRVVLVDRWVPSRVLRSAYGLMDVVLGSRLHSCVFALSQFVPVVAIGYQYKTRGVMQTLGMEDWVIDIEDVTVERLCDLLGRALTEQKTVRSHLANVLPAIREQAARAGALIAEDFHTLASARK